MSLLPDNSPITDRRDIPAVGSWPGSAALRAAGGAAVAVSGGPDSMALLWLLARAGGLRLHALTVDHGLRPDSAAEAAQVGAWVAGWPGVSHHVLSRPSPATSTRVMERARHDRYALMAGWCRDNGIANLLTAHHRDDQAETVLFRLAKGSGLDGLGGIRPVTTYDAGLTLLRPLLDAPKDALVALCDAENIPYVRDPTNGNPAFARNRLRAAMAILAAEGLNTKRLAKTAARIQAARDALEYYAKRAYEESVIMQSSDSIVLNAEIIRTHPQETRRRVLMICIENLDESRDYAPRMDVVERVTAGLFTDDGFTRASVGRFLVARQRKQGRIVVSRA